MKLFIVFVLLCLDTNSFAASKLNADQLEGLSECDYFKYTECTSAGLNIGKCIKKKYTKFSKVCGNVHAENFKYSREMFKPKIKKSKKQSCDSVKNKLCMGNSLSMSQCAAKFKKELGAACGGDDFLKEASKTDSMTECFELQKKICGNEVTLECDAKFKAQAPKKCTGTPVPESKISKGQKVSSATLMKDCASTIKKSPCKLDENELAKDGVNVQDYLRNYRVCLEKSIKQAKGKCGSHIPDAVKAKQEIEKQKAAGKKWHKPKN